MSCCRNAFEQERCFRRVRYAIGLKELQQLLSPIVYVLLVIVRHCSLRC